MYLERDFYIVAESVSMPDVRFADPSPFLWEAGSTGVLLIHGFTSSASVMRPFGKYLHGRGITISATLLPGHGTRFTDLRGVRWQNWSDHVTRGLNDLKSRCDTAFVVGQSLGALLSIHLASKRADVAGIVLLSTPFSLIDNPSRHLLPFLKYVVSDMPKPVLHFEDPSAARLHWDYDRVPVSASHEAMKLLIQARRFLPLVKCPALVVHSKKDSVVDVAGARVAFERIGSAHKQFVLTEQSGHVLTLDSDWEVTAEATHQFISEHSQSRR